MPLILLKKKLWSLWKQWFGSAPHPQKPPLILPLSKVSISLLICKDASSGSIWNVSCRQSETDDSPTQKSGWSVSQHSSHGFLLSARWGQMPSCNYKCSKGKLHLNSSQKFIYIFVFTILYIFTRPHQILNCRNKRASIEAVV